MQYDPSLHGDNLLTPRRLKTNMIIIWLQESQTDFKEVWKQAVRIPLSPSKLPRVVWSGSALPSWELRRRQWHRVSRREFRTALDLVLGAVSFPVFTSVPPECTNAFLVARWSALLPVGDSVLLRQGSERISSKEDKTNKRGLGRQTFKPTVSQLMVNRTHGTKRAPQGRSPVRKGARALLQEVKVGWNTCFELAIGWYI